MNMHDVSREEFYRATDDIKAAVNGINARLDILNGRVRKNEIKIAVQWVLWIILGATLATLAPYYVHFGR